MPASFINEPPSLVILPPIVALVPLISVAFEVVTTGAAGETVIPLSAPVFFATRRTKAKYYNGYYNATNNEAFMYDASYLKLRELKLGYTFKNIFSGKNSADLNISLLARNVLEFTQNKDVDPETLALRGQQILPGTEFLSLPSTRSYGLSLGLNF